MTKQQQRERHRGYSKAYYRRNKEACKARVLDWARANRARVCANQKRLRRKNPARMRAYTAKYKNPERTRAYVARIIREMSDYYIGHVIGVPGWKLPKSLIEAKRAQLMMERELRRKS